MVFYGVSILHCKPRGARASSSRVGSRVVLPLNSGVCEPFTLPLNAEFTREDSGFFGQCERGIRQQVSSF